jgi:hypothetical protein
MGGMRTGLLVLLATVLVGMAAGEAWVRVAEPIPRAQLLPLPYHRADLARLETGETYIRFDAELGWTTGPSASASDDGVTYRSNAAGFRAEREATLATPPGMRRLAALGDSFTHCDEVNYADCWTARLEAAWPGTETLNFGIPASAPDQGWLRYRRDARPYRPCAVLIGFQVENVNRVVNRFRPFYAPTSGVALSKPRFVLDGDGLRLLPNPAASPADLADPAWVERTLGPDDYWYYPGLFARGPLDDLMLPRLLKSAAYRRHRATAEGPTSDARPNGSAYDPANERFSVAIRVLVGFAREVARDGATPVVVFFGQKREVVGVRHDEPKEYRGLLDEVRAAGVAVVDATDALAREANRSGTDVLFARGGHFSRRGNEAVAAGLARQLPALTAATCQ